MTELGIVDASYKALNGIIKEYTEITDDLNIIDAWNKFRIVSYEQMNGNVYSGNDIDRDFWKEWIDFFGTSGTETGNVIDDYMKGFLDFLTYYSISGWSTLTDIDKAVWNLIISEAYAIFLPKDNLEQQIKDGQNPVQNKKGDWILLDSAGKIGDLDTVPTSTNMIKSDGTVEFQFDATEFGSKVIQYWAGIAWADMTLTSGGIGSTASGTYGDFILTDTEAIGGIITDMWHVDEGSGSILYNSIRPAFSGLVVNLSSGTDNDWDTDNRYKNYAMKYGFGELV